MGTCANVLILLSEQEGSSKNHTTLCILSWVLFLSVLPQPGCFPGFWRWEPGNSLGWVSWLLPRKALQLRAWLGSAWVKTTEVSLFFSLFVGFLVYFSAVSESHLFFSWAELFPGSRLPTACLVRQADKEFQVLISLSLPVVWKAVGVVRQPCCTHWWCPFMYSWVQCLSANGRFYFRWLISKIWRLLLSGVSNIPLPSLPPLFLTNKLLVQINSIFVSLVISKV